MTVMDIRVEQVNNNYKNFKILLRDSNVKQFESLKRCFNISKRRTSLITNITTLINVLEKSGELNEFHVQPLEVIAQYLDGPTRDGLKKLINVHNKLISNCKTEIPVYNHYVTNIWDRSENAPISTRIRESCPETHTNSGMTATPCITNECRATTSSLEPRYINVIECISLEIGDRWKDLARYLGLQDYEIGEIDRGQTPCSEKAKKSLHIIIGRKRDNAKGLITKALIRSRRNDLAEKVAPLL